MPNRTETQHPKTPAPAPWPAREPAPVEQQLREIRQQYPHAMVWMGQHTHHWWALPDGVRSTRLVCAASLGTLATELAEYDRQHYPQSPRPAGPQRLTPHRRPDGAHAPQDARPDRPEQHRPVGGPGAVARLSPHPVAHRATAPSSSYTPPAPPPRGRHAARRDETGMWRRAGVALGLVHQAAAA